jgi:uncharacterized protein (UPF0332 family)
MTTPTVILMCCLSSETRQAISSGCFAASVTSWQPPLRLYLLFWRTQKRNGPAARRLDHPSVWLSEDAVSRAYYATLHAAKACLHVHGVTAESHAVVKRMFSLHLIRSGELEPEWSRHLVESSDDRLAADYDAETIFSIQDAEYECQRTGAFVDRVRGYLLSKGFRGENSLCKG